MLSQSPMRWHCPTIFSWTECRFEGEIEEQQNSQWYLLSHSTIASQNRGFEGKKFRRNSREQSFICIPPPRYCSRGRIAQNHQNKSLKHRRDTVIVCRCRLFRFNHCTSVLQSHCPRVIARTWKQTLQQSLRLRPRLSTASSTTIEFTINKERNIIRNCTSSSQSATDVATRRKTLQISSSALPGCLKGSVENTTRHKGCAELKGKHTSWVDWNEPAIQTIDWGDLESNHQIHSVNTCIAVPCRVTKRVRMTKRIRRDNVYACRTLFSWKELEGTMIPSCHQRRIQPITIEGTMTMSCCQRIQLKERSDTIKSKTQVAR